MEREEAARRSAEEYRRKQEELYRQHIKREFWGTVIYQGFRGIRWCYEQQHGKK